MTLYEIVTDRSYESYVRAYAWAPSQEAALKLFKSRHGSEYAVVEVRSLLSALSEPFVTDISDSGFVMN